jgi:hypothetical protein
VSLTQVVQLDLQKISLQCLEKIENLAVEVIKGSGEKMILEKNLKQKI